MKELQNQVERFIQQHELQTTAEHFALDIVSEMGELAKEILRASNYGRESPEFRSEMASELGDLLYSLIALANHLEVDLESELHETLNKYRRRVTQGGTPDSANE
ncbi:MAG: nucleotide pyrophosphohydrolase [Candidatus Thorarchaeota archaeon]|nr:nucleotide pyrophosphohydrolase [Candidatus Thorarchaeota archaeon]